MQQLVALRTLRNDVSLFYATYATQDLALNTLRSYQLRKSLITFYFKLILFARWRYKAKFFLYIVAVLITIYLNFCYLKIMYYYYLLKFYDKKLRLVLLFGSTSIYQHFTVSETATCLTCILLLQITPFNIINPASFKLGCSVANVWVNPDYKLSGSVNMATHYFHVTFCCLVFRNFYTILQNFLH